jgi:hypothetical protein
MIEIFKVNGRYYDDKGREYKLVQDMTLPQEAPMVEQYKRKVVKEVVHVPCGCVKCAVAR